jgi:mannosylglycoprotein endo-beta-mannosidase
MLEDLEEKGCISCTQASIKSEIQMELLVLLEKEEAFWQQRSREKWLLHGDNNTSFFHRIADGRKRKRTIFSLKDGDNVIQGTPALLEHAIEFYKNLFGPIMDTGVRLNDNICDEGEKLDEADRESLNTPFTEEEIHQVIDQMERNKAASPDGIPVEFYQHCWCVVKTDIMNMFNAFHSHQINLERINYGIIKIIPKSDDAEIIQKYRPICLLQVLFKIFTKTMTVRVEPITSKLIHPC